MIEPTYLLIKTLSNTLIGTRLPGQNNDSEIVLKNVMVIQMEEDDGVIFYSMLPYFILYENEPVTFNPRYILEQSVPTDNFVNIYKKSFEKYMLNFKENNQETTRENISAAVKMDKNSLN